MREPQPNAIQLKDYAPPAFLVDSVELDVDIRAEDALVRAVLALRRNPQAANARDPLVLDGEALELVSLAVDGAQLRANAYSLSPTRLEITQLPDACLLETVLRIVPQQNTKLEGLYATKTASSPSARREGFRRITWFPTGPT